MKPAALAVFSTCSLAFIACAQSGYTNHAGNVVSGVVVALDVRTATISNATETAELPLSIFPESERRRIAADFGQPRVPPAVKRAIAGAEKAMARSRKRAEKGSLHEGGERCLLREVRGRAQELSRQAGPVGRPHPRRAQGARAVATGA